MKPTSPIIKAISEDKTLSGYQDNEANITDYQGNMTE
jgi:hypothetical protein